MLRKKICFDIQMEYLTFVILNDPFITFSCRLSQIFAIDCRAHPDFSVAAPPLIHSHT